MKIPASASIGIFDSGLGGLSVLRAIHTLLPHENTLYFGDTARVPYGNKNPNTILRYSLENTSFLTQQPIKILVVACNTACSVALEPIRKASPVPVVGITEQGVEAVSHQLPTGTMAILGTKTTLSSQTYQRQILLRCPNLKLIPIPCPLLVPLIEEGYAEHPISTLILKEYLLPLQQTTVDGVLLGCTHYPFLKNALQEQLRPGTPLIDPAHTCAEEIRKLLNTAGLLNPSSTPARHQFFVSDDPDKFRELGQTFLNFAIEEVLLA